VAALSHLPRALPLRPRTGRYRDANAHYASLVEEEAHPGDLVWVNDFHLCLVPSTLRARGRGLRVGMFWHIPFPPPTVFGICPWREELLRGMLGADLLAFQTDVDTQHFLACVREFLGVEVLDDPWRIRVDDREIRLATLPVGVDVERLSADASSASAIGEARALRGTLGTDSVKRADDRLDYTKGIIERLRGFERFLESAPEWRGRVSLVQITAPSRFRVPQYRAMKQTITRPSDARAASPRAAARRSSTCTTCSTTSSSRPTRAADVVPDAARDGMNLVAKEHARRASRGDGVLVLSGSGRGERARKPSWSIPTSRTRWRTASGGPLRPSNGAPAWRRCSSWRTHDVHADVELPPPPTGGGRARPAAGRAVTRDFRER
jgi:trehalose-6-phosphate synthase